MVDTLVSISVEVELKMTITLLVKKRKKLEEGKIEQRGMKE